MSNIIRKVWTDGPWTIIHESKKRGRPPKAQVHVEPKRRIDKVWALAPVDFASRDSAVVDAAPKRRGRPRKKP